MKTKVVYVLVSQESDYFLERMLLSIYSLRLNNPGAGVTILTDDETSIRLNSVEMLDDVEVLTVDIPDAYKQMEKSRYLKTRMRFLVEGAFLYLDTDTIICGKLDELEVVDADVAMVSNWNGELTLSLSSTDSVHFCREAGFGDLIGKPYFNGGVIYVSDTNESYRLFEAWHSRWLESLANGIPLDQPALAQANMDCGYLIKEISGKYNWQISCSAIPYPNSSCIIHYYNCRFGRRLLPEHIRVNGVDEKIQKLVSSSPFQIYKLFTLSDDRLCDYLLSDMLLIFSDYPNFFKSVTRFARLLIRPVSSLSKLKRLIKRH